jgi:hypothetical protein
MDEKYIVYVRADEAGRIVEINSSAFLADTAGWTAIDEGYGDKYHHAQGNYFALPLYGPDGCANYKLADGTPALRTEAEKAAESAAQVRQAVLKGVISEAQYKEITGEAESV